MAEDARVRTEVMICRGRLDGLASAAALEPPPRVWQRIKRELDCLEISRERLETSTRRGRRGLRFWQACAALAASAALVLAFQLQRENQESIRAQAGRSAIVMDDQPDSGTGGSGADQSAGAAEAEGFSTRTLRLPREDSARWRVGFDAGSRRLSVQSIGYPWIDTSEDYELWWLDGDAIVPMGLLPRDGGWQLTMPRQTRVTDASRLVITREPAFGSQADGPTGPVLINTLLRPRS